MSGAGGASERGQQTCQMPPHDHKESVVRYGEGREGDEIRGGRPSCKKVVE